MVLESPGQPLSVFCAHPVSVLTAVHLICRSVLISRSFTVLYVSLVCWITAKLCWSFCVVNGCRQFSGRTNDFICKLQRLWCELTTVTVYRRKYVELFDSVGWVSWRASICISPAIYRHFWRPIQIFGWRLVEDNVDNVRVKCLQICILINAFLKQNSQSSIVLF